MNERVQSLSWILSTALFGVVVIGLVLLIQTGALPVEAALQSNRPEAITNPQRAAILGGQNLLQFEQVVHFVYLPILTR